MFRGILHDENLYPEPMAFKPERFIGKYATGVNDYPIEGFGAGRRCAELADESRN